jgi:hypothetical protein
MASAYDIKEAERLWGEADKEALKAESAEILGRAQKARNHRKAAKQINAAAEEIARRVGITRRGRGLDDFKLSVPPIVRDAERRSRS